MGVYPDKSDGGDRMQEDWDEIGFVPPLTDEEVGQCPCCGDRGVIRNPCYRACMLGSFGLELCEIDEPFQCTRCVLKTECSLGEYIPCDCTRAIVRR